MNTIYVRIVSGLALVLILLIGWSITAPAIQSLGASLAPVPQAEMAEDRIYAYRNWQSVGVRVEQGDRIGVRASGTWLYTPDEYHGPEGHARFPAPSYYPVPGAGGTLIGRIGESGPPLYVGRRAHFAAERSGLLYFRINDDLLSDNDGYVTVEVEVTPADELEQSTR